jgi:hypothetical protein
MKINFVDKSMDCSNKMEYEYNFLKLSFQEIYHTSDFIIFIWLTDKISFQILLLK